MILGYRNRPITALRRCRAIRKRFFRGLSNFIADARSALVDPSEAKGSGVRITSFDMGGSTLVGHLAEWPVGRYHKAHFHQGGAILLILRSEGYTLMWPQEAGLRPYQQMLGNQVVKVDWQEGSVVSPPTGWFHQHFNTGKEPARYLALRWGSRKFSTAREEEKIAKSGIQVSWSPKSAA